ncbi:MAG: Ig-like domain repeat protein [Acidimicrobiales bacterium]
MTTVVLASAVVLCTGTLVFALTCFTGPKPTPPFGLTWNMGFRITSTISSSRTSQIAALLYPGTQRYLWYTAHNPLEVPITVTSLSIKAVTSQSPTGCPTSNLNYSQTTFSGTPTLVVPARVGAVDGANSVPVPISLYDTDTNQDKCEGMTFNFVYSGTAVYTDTSTTALTSWHNPSASGSLVTFTASVVPTGTPPGNPTGTVNFYLCSTASCTSTTLLGSGSLSAYGMARYSTSSLAAGTDFIEAIYQGAPTDFAGSTSNVVSQVVTTPTATTTALTSAPNPSVFGGTVVFSATVARSAGTGTPTGSVNFYQCASATNCSSPTLLGSGTLSSGKAAYSTSGLPVGTTYVEAVYEGVPGSFSSSTSNVVTQVVSRIATTTVLSSAPNPSVSGHSVTFTATVTASNASVPTGTVNFYSCPSVSCASTTLFGTGTIGAGGKATFSTSSLPVGMSYVEAVYPGTSTNFNGSTSNVVTQVVTSSTVATTTALTSTPNPSSYGTSVTFTATVTPAESGTVTGTVSFYSCASTACTTKSLLGTGTVGTANKATVSISSLPVGTTIVEAVYGGSTTYLASTSNTVSQVVNLVATTTALGSSPNPSQFGKPVTLTATLTKSSGTGTPTGTVSFYLGTPTGTHSLLGTATLTSGQATLVISSLPAGTDSLYAVYGGDTNFSGSTSPVISQVVVSLPSRCTDNYTNWIFGNPAFPDITGRNGNDFIYAFGGSYRVNDFNGDDCCLYAGDGNNWLSDGNGNDVAQAGDGNNDFTLGNGNDQIVVGNGTSTIGAGNGSDSVTVGNGPHNGVTLGNGTDSVTVGSGVLQPSRSRLWHRRGHDSGRELRHRQRRSWQRDDLSRGRYLQHLRRCGPSHEPLPPARTARLLARDRCRLLSRHDHQLHGGDPVRRRGVFRVRGVFVRPLRQSGAHLRRPAHSHRHQVRAVPENEVLMARREYSAKGVHRAMRPRRWRRAPIVLGAVVALVLGLSAGSAYGYLTTHGSGKGLASTETMKTVTMATAGTPSTPLLPGGTGDVVFSVTNPNNFPVSLVSVGLETDGTITPNAGHSGCATTDGNPVVTLNVPSGDLPVAIPANTTQPIDLASAASMDAAATSNCQGATFDIPLTITVHSS